MATTLKVLGQQSPTANTTTDLYTVPAATQAAVATVTACNTGTAIAQIRLLVAPAGAATATEHYFVYDMPLAPNETVTFTLGITMAATDVLRCRSTLANVAFGAYGQERT